MLCEVFTGSQLDVRQYRSQRQYGQTHLQKEHIRQESQTWLGQLDRSCRFATEVATCHP